MVRLSRLDKALCISSIAATMLAVAAVAWSTTPHPVPPPYAAGDRFEDIPDLDPAAASSTIVLWVDSRCPACTASAAFYRRLTTQPLRARVVVMGRQRSQILQTFVDTSGLHAAQVISVGDLPLKLKMTPTIVLIGPDSLVRSAWEGRRQTAAEEDEVIRTAR
jgi:hypothetical protein